MVCVYSSARAALTGDGFRKHENVLTDKVAVRYNIVILFLEADGQVNSTTTVCIVQIVKAVFCVCVQSSDTIAVCGIKYDVDFEAVRIIRFLIRTPIFIADTLVTELDVGKSELPVQVGIRSG